MRRFGFLFGLLALLSASRFARAAGDDAEPVRVQFDGPIACSDEARFFADVRARTPRVRLAAATEPARVFRVRVVPEDGGVEGTIWAIDASNVSSPRVIHAPTCEQAIDALELIAALTVDPSAPLRAPLSSREAPPPSPSSSAAPAPAAPSSVAREPAPPSPYVISLGAGPTVTAPNAPSDALGARAFAEVERRATWSLRASFDLPTQRTLAEGTSAARLTWVRGALDACPFRFTLAPGLSTAPCAGVEAGALEGSGSRIVNEASANRPWVAGLAEARLRYELLRVLFAELDAGVTVPFVREQFVFLPSTAIYQAPPVLFRGLFSVGVRFP